MSPPWWSSSSSHVLSLRVDAADDLTFSGQITRASLRSLEGVIMPNSPSNPDQHHRLKKSPAAEGAHVVGWSEVGIGRSHREDSLAGGQPEETDIGPHDPAVSINHTLASKPELVASCSRQAKVAAIAFRGVPPVRGRAEREPRSSQPRDLLPR